ncbi:DUF726 domain-containing protein [Vibrio breoganii]
MARGKPGAESRNFEASITERLTDYWDNELCAEHDGTISSFERLSMSILDITDYEKIFLRDKYDLSRVGIFAGFGVLGVVGIAGVAATVGGGAPAVAAALGNMGLLGSAATGVTISSLSGAALTSASLAAIGGSIAVGTAVVSASGAALGGVLGGVVANNYYSEDESFAIRRISNGSSKKIIFINGFTQEFETNFVDWKRGQSSFDPNPSMYSLNWGAKSNAMLGKAFATGVFSQTAKTMLIQIAKTGSVSAAKKLSPLAWTSFLAELATNPWHTAMVRAAQAGVQLAEAISRTEGQKFTLVGHSLGCRVIYYALEALASKEENYIEDVILLGGAVGRNDEKGWSRALSAIEGSLYNCHSENDSILAILYQTANAGLSSPIGYAPICLDNSKLINVDCSELVDSHMNWKKYYSDILNKINSFSF